MRFTSALLLAFSLLVFAAGGARAEETGTLAWTTRPLTLYEGPGRSYEILGNVGSQLRLRVDRCTYQWCQIHTDGARGWVWRMALNFGQYPIPLWARPTDGYKWGGPGQVCLFEGRNFTGASLCLRSGQRSKDLLLQHLDNRFSSVSVAGRVSITLCRDRNWTSYCERVEHDQPVLNGFLDNNVSSYVVH
jgi:hypothetical protein